MASAFFNCLAVIPTILLDALFIFTVATRSSLRSNSNILLALSGTDFPAGLILQAIAIAINVKAAFGIEPFCTLQMAHSVGLSGQAWASFSHLFLVSIDRYIAVKHALRYRVIVTKQKIKMYVLVAWAIWL